jgi:hypothetical protein
MLKTLTPIGDELALILDPEMLETLHIDRDTHLDVSTDGVAVHTLGWLKTRGF